jgi:hypothetical protein
VATSRTPGIAADGYGRERNRNVEHATTPMVGANVPDVQHAPDDLVVHKRVVDRLDRHLDIMLERTMRARSAIERVSLRTRQAA